MMQEKENMFDENLSKYDQIEAKRKHSKLWKHKTISAKKYEKIYLYPSWPAFLRVEIIEQCVKSAQSQK